MKLVAALLAWAVCLSSTRGTAAASGSGGTQRELDRTPTWAVASICAIFVIISILLEMFLHKLRFFLTNRHKKALFEALEKVKAELMILGFISLLLTFGEISITNICVPFKAVDTMLPWEDIMINSSYHVWNRLMLSEIPTASFPTIFGSLFT